MRFGFRARRGGPTATAQFLKATMVTAALFGTGCYQYRAIAQAPATPDAVGGAQGPSTETERKTVWALFWGTVNSPPEAPIDNCNAQDLYEVTVSTNVGYALLTVATLGFVSPATVEWKCAKAAAADSVIGSAVFRAPDVLVVLRPGLPLSEVLQ